MGPLEAVERALARYATFHGRARRSELGWFTVATVVVVGVPLLVGIGLLLLGLLLGGGAGLAVAGYGAYLVLVAAALQLGLLVPWFAVSVRRLHDTGRSAAWLGLVRVPRAGVLLHRLRWEDGEPGPNRFGPDAKGRPSSLR